MNFRRSLPEIRCQSRLSPVCTYPICQGRRKPPLFFAAGTDKTAMNFWRSLPEIRWQSCLSPVFFASLY